MIPWKKRVVDIDVVPFHWEHVSGIIVTKWDHSGEDNARCTQITLFHEEAEELVRLLRENGYGTKYLYRATEER